MSLRMAAVVLTGVIGGVALVLGVGQVVGGDSYGFGVIGQAVSSTTEWSREKSQGLKHWVAERRCVAIEAEDAEVLAVVLSLFQETDADNVVHSVTDWPVDERLTIDDIARCFEDKAGLDQLIAGFRRANTWTTRTIDQLPPDTQFAVRARAGSRDRPSNWVQLSSVGYDQSGSAALVYVEWFSSVVCDRGMYVLLSREAGSWHVDDTCTTWIQ